MRYLALLLALPAFAFQLSNGTYHTVESNNDSVCPQKIRIQKEDEIVFLKVVYVGDCYYQGPYTYYCVEDMCTDGQIDYQVTSQESFTWVNRNYRIWGKFKKD